jgi:hypothetical protein
MAGVAVLGREADCPHVPMADIALLELKGSKLKLLRRRSGCACE